MYFPVVNVLYEESGALKVGTVLADAESSLQIQAPHGKRAKIKAKDVLLRFNEPAASELLPQAEALAGNIDIDFLWQCCGGEEFGFDELARDYCGRMPSSVEATAILVKLHSAPMYFYRKGRGRYRAAPADTLRAALAGVERKKRQALQIDAWAKRLVGGELPDEFRPLLEQLLYQPDRNRPETKALEQACETAGLSPPKLLERCGALPSSHDYHLKRFLFEYFPRGPGFPETLEAQEPRNLPLAKVSAFSLDDVHTTEIDDAFSIERIESGRLRVGIHIAAPGLGFAPDSALGRVARERLSTVYVPGGKITMLPPAAIERFTLAEGKAGAALSLYLDVRESDFAVENRHTRIERVPIAANLRHPAVAALDAAFQSGKAREDVAYAHELETLWRFALALEQTRGKPAAAAERPEYTFRVEPPGENARVTITERKRGTPLEKLVAELMIAVNSTWGKLLDDHDIAAIYRVQTNGKVRMSTSAAPHQGLGASHYAWASSPLRRYVDLVNQWQLVSLLQGEAPPFSRNADVMLAAVHDFETTYAAYDEFQRRMEHYWCLRWLIQEGIEIAAAEVVRDNLVKLDGLPLYVRTPSLPELPAGSRVEIAVTVIDLIDNEVRCTFRRRLDS